ncbi:MAG: hypothetical protein CHACPFDD_01506 [Phycisphaerae bacterium]|nr:hypothetical protein [Phycisphaerae bacterium]
MLVQNVSCPFGSVPLRVPELFGAVAAGVLCYVPREGRARRLVIVAVLTALPAALSDAYAQDARLPDTCLVIGPVGRGARAAIRSDAVELQVVSGTWRAPAAGDTLTLADGTERAWRVLSAGKDGFEADELRNGYACLTFDAPADQIVILDAAGHGMVYANGEPRAGDVYRTGKTRLPIRVRRGPNELLFHVQRGGFRARLDAPQAAVYFDPCDNTLPDLVVGEACGQPGAVLLVNASDRPLHGLTITAQVGAAQRIASSLPVVPPLSTRKVALQIVADPPEREGTVDLHLRLLPTPSGDEAAPSGERALPLAELTLPLAVKPPTAPRNVTFFSRIDGSVQYYAVLPAQPPPGSAPKPGIVLSLHGAGVEASGQAAAYAAKPWCHIVAPTNRRPFGFDWEDFGRTDALEVLAHARRHLVSDPALTCLTGHSMGGHGTWQLAALFPDRFAAIGPSAGWSSFMSYGGAPAWTASDGAESVFRRARSSSDTLLMLRNFAGQNIYVLHGDADDNVPVQQAREMRERLAGCHRTLQWHEQPGAGHWWDASDEPGTDCVDWPAMFDLFARSRMPDSAAVREVEFVTVNPAVSSSCHWVEIWQQERPLEPSSVQLRCDPHRRRFSGRTENVAALALRIEHLPPGDALEFAIDDQTFTCAIPAAPPGGAANGRAGGFTAAGDNGAERVWLSKAAGAWSAALQPPPAAYKSPARGGPFKLAFDHQVVFVYGTIGSADENAWSLAKARFDAETFWYRGNGSVDVIPDTDFQPAQFRDRGVVLYGDRDTNAAYASLLPDAPIVVRRGAVQVGPTTIAGDDLACLFCYPRRDSDDALVAVVGGTGRAGLRLCDRLPYFMSGVAFPDYCVLSPQMLHEGFAGVRAAGFFDQAWRIAPPAASQPASASEPTRSQPTD